MDKFLKKMKDLLLDDYNEFLHLMDKPAFRAVRANTLKCDSEKLKSLLPFVKEKVPFCEEGFYIDSDTEHIGSHPLHHAGAFYVQEPSAMSAVTMLDVKPDDKVLDLCAAPGSKTTQIASKLSPKGLLWSNEIVKSRTAALLSNIERCGIKNAVVSSTSPDVLCPQLTGFFDKVLVDAPCSGEGMFRKDKSARNEWSEEHVRSCANRQLMILNCAKHSLATGGVMVYSTCTYSVEENEGVITAFLNENPEFELVDSGCEFGRNTLNYAKRIFPMDGGEGHFSVKLKKKCDSPYNSYDFETKAHKKNNAKILKLSLATDKAYEFKNEIFGEDIYKNLYTISDKVIALSDSLVDMLSLQLDLRQLSVIKMGVEIAVDRGKRYEPSHNAFTACDSFCKNILDLSLSDERLYRFLHGEEIPLLKNENVKGYTLVCVEGIPLSFGKASGATLKNKYPKGLRNNG